MLRYKLIILRSSRTGDWFGFHKTFSHPSLFDKWQYSSKLCNYFLDSTSINSSTKLINNLQDIQWRERFLLCKTKLPAFRKSRAGFLAF